MNLLCWENTRMNHNWKFLDCGTPTSVTSATRSYSSTVLNSVVTYACQTGYTHTGGDLQRTCGSDGVWGGVLPTCIVGKTKLRQ